MHAIFTFHSGYIPIKQVFKRAGGDKLYIPFWIYSNDIKNKVLIFDDNFTFHSGYIPIRTTTHQPCILFSLHSILDIFQYVKAEFNTAIPIFTFHSGYIPIMPIVQYHLDFKKALHSILDIFQSVDSAQISSLNQSLHSILDIFQFLYLP